MFDLVFGYASYLISFIYYFVSTVLVNLYYNFFFLIQVILASSIIGIVLMQKNPDQGKGCCGPRGRPDIMTYIVGGLGLLLAINTMILCAQCNKSKIHCVVSHQ